MIYTVAIDPGKNHCGVAVFRPDNSLMFIDVISVAHLVPAPITSLAFRQGSIKAHDCIQPVMVATALCAVLASLRLQGAMINFVSEWPDHYEDIEKKGLSTRNNRGVKARDLFWLSACAAACGAMCMPLSVRYFLPKEWKSNVPDEICWQRITKRFDSESERALIAALHAKHGANFHHGLEAGGIGLYALYRDK